MQRPGTPAVASAATLGVLLVGLVGLAITVRPPWLDELTTLYFLEHPGVLLDRWSGDPHPPAYYLLILPARMIWLGSAWLRAAGLILLPAAAAICCWGLVEDRTTWARTFLVAGIPAFAGSAVALIHGTSLRMYGGMALAIVVVASALHVWSSRPSFDRRHRWAATAALTLLATLHVWGLLFAALFTVGIVVHARPRFRDLVPHALTAALIVTPAWLYGPLSVEDPSAKGVPDFDPLVYVGWVFNGISHTLLIAALVLAVWAASVVLTRDRQTLWWFDLPALGTIALAAAVSVVVPSAKDYTLALAVVPLLAGTALRLSSLRPAAYLAFVVVLGANGASHMPIVLQGPAGQGAANWEASTALVRSEADSGCPVLAYPFVSGQFHTRWYLTEMPVEGIYNPEPCKTTCERRWFVANHLYPTHREDFLRSLDDPAVEAVWTTAMVGTVPC